MLVVEPEVNVLARFFSDTLGVVELAGRDWERSSGRYQRYCR